jgi:hypothetical protein
MNSLDVDSLNEWLYPWLKPRCLVKCIGRLLVAKIWVQYVGFIARVLSFGPLQQGVASRARRPSSCTLTAILHCISLVIYASFYTHWKKYALLEHISIHYRSTFLYIIVGCRWSGITNCWGSSGSHVLPPRRHLPGGAPCHDASPLYPTDGDDGPFPLRIQPRLSSGSQQGFMCILFFIFMHLEPTV